MIFLKHVHVFSVFLHISTDQGSNHWIKAHAMMYLTLLV